MRKALLVAALFLACAFGALQVSRARTFQLFGTIVPRVETQRKIVALTFDDGPRAETLDEILAPLAAANVKATFFVIGGELQENPGVAKKLVQAGHELGNHSYSHKRMVFKSASFIASEFERTDALIRATGYQGRIHVRAPYCKKLVGLPLYFAKTKRTHVTWDVEPETDPDIDRDAQRIAQHVLANTRPGSIILLHPWYRGRENTRKALPLILDGLRKQGYAFVTVDELMNGGA